MFMQNMRGFAKKVLDTKPVAKASIKGFSSRVHGYINFYSASGGTLIVTEMYNLPKKVEGAKTQGIYGFHVHNGSSCEKGTKENPFPLAGTHYNPANAIHPYHAGDMPVLFGNNGYAYMSFYTNRFTPSEVIGHTVIIHSQADDFRTQPSGDSGKMIACGEIKKFI